MSGVVAIGEARRLTGFALAGVDVRTAETAQAAHDEWDGLERDVGLLILTPEAAAALEGRRSEREDIVWVSLPE
ncbi:MAG TPA: V-type ATP synthase subunit F [Gaiellaceae bacterium]|nr:V-type ATP synthase subunit F [Gaiellaceae bacterium]HLG07464.1 V-type ATP synthase subunit F [Gaiellaceae bacterium]